MSTLTKHAPIALAAAIMAASPVPVLAQEQMIPSAANPGVRDFDDPDLVQLAGAPVGAAPLAVFLPGTGGRSENAPTLLMNTIAQQGYNVVYLTSAEAAA